MFALAVWVIAVTSTMPLVPGAVPVAVCSVAKESASKSSDEASCRSTEPPQGDPPRRGARRHPMNVDSKPASGVVAREHAAEEDSFLGRCVEVEDEMRVPRVERGVVCRRWEAGPRRPDE